ncbi:MAG: heavy metal-binding domain-containing protein [Leptolyngbyaceae cyanobacterium T60_A2020_046]|nr:heavy metal-binding domain-containing protein [Leptolyngbyaceae cyanobacterium T60_A2020_046]
MDLLNGIIIFIILLGLGFFVGSATERKHFQDLRDREYRTRLLPILSIGAKTPIREADEAALVVGSVVIASDYFKTFVASWIQVFGGRIAVHETLLERGRREAILRMKEDAIAWKARKVVNVRLETAELGGQMADSGPIAIEIIAYGTAVK